MSGVVAFIRRCLAAGMDSETALMAAEQFESGVEAEVAKALMSRRASDRERQRRHRHVSHVMSRDERDNPSPKDTPVPSSTPSLDQNPNPPPYKSPALPKPNGFARFWEAYPNKVGKRAAETAYQRALKRADAGAIFAGLERAESSRAWADGFIPHPTTWLNQDRWLDEPDETARGPPVSAGMLAAAAREAGLRMAIDNLERGHGRSDLEGGSGSVVALPRLNQIAR